MVNENGKSVVLRIPTELQLEPNETSPLNQRGPDNHSDSSTASAVASEQSTRKLIGSSEMDHSKRILLRIGIDFLLLCCVGVPIILLFLICDPYERGFFCSDESLMHPYHNSTVKHWMLYVFGVIMPVTLILIIELIRGRLNLDGDRQIKLLSWSVPVCVQNLYKYIGFFLFGVACCQLTTDIAKYSIGRLRPHFISVCDPIMSDGTDCTNPINMHRYVSNFTCRNPEATDKVLKDMRMSFPSANSSFSFFTMLFCVLYLHTRLSWKGSALLKYFLQFVFLLMAWFTSLTRISDYKHHWSDVVAGAALGIFFSLITNYCIKATSNEGCRIEKISTKYELNAKSTNGNNS